MLAPENLQLAEQLVDASYVRLAGQSAKAQQNRVKTLLSQRTLPTQPWDDRSIELFLAELAAMDSNNFLGNVGVGERESRVFSDIVRRRHFSMGHGIGRSGELAAVQPKAAGSSLLLKVATFLALDALKLAGITETKSCLILPMATGMTLVMALLALKAQRPSAKYVIWPRIDQKTCLKCIFTAGLEPLVIDNELDGDEVRTDMKAMQDAIERVGAENIVCVLSTNSCFAPRAPDRLADIARLCQRTKVAHLVNNAYGLQSRAACEQLLSASRVGRVDAYVQSTDKNFMVPVGGAILAGFKGSTVVDDVSKMYPGRASMAPVLDLAVTLLAMGKQGWLRVLKEREELTVYFRQQMAALADRNGERVLHTPNNHISIAMTLTQFDTPPIQKDTLQSAPSSAASSQPLSSDIESVPSAAESTTASSAVHPPSSSAPTVSRSSPPVSFLGSMLFTRNVSGPRVVARTESKSVCGIAFKSFGAHYSGYPCSYLTMACALGMTKRDVDSFIEMLARCLTDLRKKSGMSPLPPLEASSRADGLMVASSESVAALSTSTSG